MRLRTSPSRTWVFDGSALATLCVLSACSAVDDSDDRLRASQLASSRTGSEYRSVDAGAIEAEIWNRLVNGLEIEEAVSLALLNDGSLHARFEAIGISRADLVQSQLFRNPSLSLSFKFPLSSSGPVDFTGNLGQQIADLWQIPVRRAIAEKQLEVAILEAANAAIDVAARARSAVYRQLAAQEMVAILEQDALLAQRSIEFAETQFRAGEVSEVDVNLARASALDVEEQRLRARGDLAVARADLLEALGLASRAVEIELRVEWPRPSALPNREELIARALERRLDIQSATIELEQRRLELRHAENSRWSSVEVGAEYEKIGPERALGPTFGFEIPIFDDKSAAIARANAAIREAEETLRAQRERVAGDVCRSSSEVDTASQLAEFHRTQSLPRAQALVDGAEQRFRAGEESVFALIEAQESLAARRRAAVIATRDHALAEVALERALGGR